MAQIEQKLLVLSKIAQALNQRNLTWGVGASLLLYFKGIVSDFHDIDIMVSEEEVDKAKEVLLSFGILQPPNPNATYKTKNFMEFIVDEVEIDVMAGFIIVRNDYEHHFPLKKENIKEFHQINGVQIPLQTLGEWRTYYQLMGREEKVRLIDAWQQRT